MCSRPSRAGSTVGGLPLGVAGTPLRPPDALVAPVQNAHLPFLSEGPLPVSSTQPTSGWGRVVEHRSSSSTVCGRNALSTSGRSKAIRTVPWARGPVVREVGQVLEAGTSSQAAGSNVCETPSMAVMRATLVAVTCPGDPPESPARVRRTSKPRPAPMLVPTAPSRSGPTAPARATPAPAAGPGHSTRSGTFASGREDATNQRMEIQAALEAVRRQHGPAAGGERLDVRRELLPRRLVAGLAGARLDQHRQEAGRQPRPVGAAYRPVRRPAATSPSAGSRATRATR